MVRSRGDAHHVRLCDSLHVVCAFDMSVTIPLSPLINSSLTVVKACANSNANRHVQQFYKFNCAVIGWGPTGATNLSGGRGPLSLRPWSRHWLHGAATWQIMLWHIYMQHP